MPEYRVTPGQHLVIDHPDGRKAWRTFSGGETVPEEYVHVKADDDGREWLLTDGILEVIPVPDPDPAPPAPEPEPEPEPDPPAPDPDPEPDPEPAPDPAPAPPPEKPAEADLPPAPDPAGDPADQETDA